MQVLRGLVAIMPLAYSVNASPAGVVNVGQNLGVEAVQSHVADRQETTLPNGPVITSDGNSAQLITTPSDGTVVTMGNTEGPKPVPISDTGLESVAAHLTESTPMVVDIAPSTTTAIEIAVATVGVTATETVAVGAIPPVDTSAEVAASEAVGSNEPVPVNINSTTSITSNSSNPDYPLVAILGGNDTTPYTGSNSSIIAILGGEDTDDEVDDVEPTGTVPILGNSSIPIIIGRKMKRQLAAENMGDSDSITFQTHAGEGFVQPQVVPVFQQVVDTTTTDTTTTSSSTTTESTSTTLTSGTTTTTTTSWTSITGTTTSTSTTWEPSTTATPGVLTTWVTSSQTTCIPPETHTTAPLATAIPATCTDTTTLCTVTLAYVISMNPTTTSYYTTTYDSNTAATTATQTIYSDDPNGFHVYITTQDNSNGDATATYFFTTPQPTVISQQINLAEPNIPNEAVLYTSLVLFWSFMLIVVF
ncbi:hypothetical protein AOL_s00097g23 [Orbilia oligospora ATCC 24927]|uniref:Uncharacterized protein n=2 Tax=Orbilia oligospora TaxID=2813651 RepID=G1XI46_ARTOA|nr:hypothetical protein AOL_s00097g23 [Orbilia oligospora ATCC 24927]EGX47184.1 hypothetical protein AOL_s00097g23 [Orbilia oligospora ATCC 24927]KAF3270126.1 hypothetical protein TWF970_010809 [Orbilia oligospora]